MMTLAKHATVFTLSCLGTLVIAFGLRWNFSQYGATATSGLRGLRSLESPPDVLFVGSSHTRQSYDPVAFEGRVGLSAYVLAYNGLDPWMMALLVPGILRDHKPGLIVIEIYTARVMRPPGVSDTRLFLDSPPPDKPALLRRMAAGMPEFGAWEAFDLLLLRGNDNLLTRPLVGGVLDRASVRGGYDGKIAPGLSVEAFRRLKPPEDVKLEGGANSRNWSALRALLAELRRLDARVLFVETPMPRPISSAPGIVSTKRAIAELVSAEGFEYVDGDTLLDNSDPSLFTDSSHLSTEGRRVFTAVIADRIAIRLREPSVP